MIFEHSMKWAFILIGVLLLLTGCFMKYDTDKIAELEPFCVEFNEAVEHSGPTLEALEVLDLCSKKLQKEEFTNLIFRYEMLLVEHSASFSNRIFNRGSHETLYEIFPDQFDPEGISRSTDPSFRSTLTELVNSGYTLTKSEKGLYKVQIDYTFFERFKENLTVEAIEYFKIMHDETMHSLFGEEYIQGSPDELGMRLIRLDRYVNDHPKSIRLKEISQLANEYLLTLAYGYEEEDPYDKNDVIKDSYLDVYKKLSNISEKTQMTVFFEGVIVALEESELSWNRDVYDFIVGYPEIYRKRHIESSIYPDAFVDVGFGWTTDGDFYYYPVFEGIPNRSEQGKLNLMSRSLVENRMVGRGFSGMHTGGKYVWSDYELTFNRREWLSLRFEIYVEQADEQYYWTYESINYDLKEKRVLYLNDVLETREEREVVNAAVKKFFDESRTYYAVSLEDFYKNPNPEFYLTNTGITIIVPLEVNAETMERVVEIFIPFRKFRSSVEYIYKIPERNME